MNAFIDRNHAVLPSPPLLIPLRVPIATHLLSLLVLLVALGNAAASGSAPARQLSSQQSSMPTWAEDVPQVVGDKPTSRRRRRSRQPGTTSLQQDLVAGSNPLAKDSGRRQTRRRRRRRRRKKSRQRAAAPQLDQSLVGHVVQDHISAPIAKSQNHISAHAPALSLLSLRSPVHKAKPPSDTDGAAPAPPAASIPKESQGAPPKTHTDRPIDEGQTVAELPRQGVLWDSAGVRVAQSWETRLGGLPSQSTPPNGNGVIVIRIAVCMVAVLTMCLLAFVASEVARTWRHQLTLRAVRAKVRRAHEFFLGLHGEQELCLSCVEFLPSSSAQTVTFLCGHAFHVKCVKDWYKRHSRDADEAASGSCPGRCPICAGQEGLASPVPPASFYERKVRCDGDGPAVPFASTGASPASSASQGDHAWLFTLHGLCERYPDIITKEDSERLASQPTEVLLSEIQFARQSPQPRKHTFFG